MAHDIDLIRILLVCFNRSLSICCRNDVVALGFQQRLDQFEQQFLVFHQQECLGSAGNFRLQHCVAFGKSLGYYLCCRQVE